MVRNLMLIVGLSLAVGAFGCSDDDGGTAGTGGGGTGGMGGGGTGGMGGGGTGGMGGGGTGGMGGGGTGGAPGADGACLDQMDIDVICADAFPTQLAGCGLPNQGNIPAINECIVTTIGLSEACAECWGESTQCLIDNCLQPCLADAEGEDCTNCRAEFCDPDLESCAGDYGECP